MQKKSLEYKLVVGLGNPGEKYSKNRHNTGFIVLDKLLESKNIKFTPEPKFECEIARHQSLPDDMGLDYDAGQNQTIFIKPTTFMNNSGTCVAKVANFYKIDPDGIYVIHDDLDLELGRVKTQLGAGSAGHNGVEDIFERLGTRDFWRVRIGIGRPSNPEIDVADWVLKDFSSSEIDKILFIAKHQLVDLF